MTYTDKLFLAIFVALLLLSKALKAWPPVKEWVIVAISALIMLSWGAASLIIFVAIAAVNYWFAVRLSFNKRLDVLSTAIVLNLLCLSIFKYYDFFRANIAVTTGWEAPIFSLGIPLAISFYTFHIISYLVDIHRGKAALVGVRQYFFYLGFFPHLVAGPIVRPWQLLPQIGRIRKWAGDGAVGLHHLMVGMCLKLVIANNLGALIDPVWNGEPGFTPTSVDRLAVAFFYYCQIYADFAGYTLIALGMARLLGYRLPPNFRQPMFARSLREFWTRWHITLSRWLRDFLYIPLGGSRGGLARTLVNLFATMLLGGLWHGAGWGFVIWGAMHGAGLGAERILKLRDAAGGVRLAWWLVTQFWVTVAWIFFRVHDPATAASFVGGLVPTQAASFAFHSELAACIPLAAAVVAHQVIEVLRFKYRRKIALILATSTVVAFMLDLLIVAPPSVFIYFRF